MNRTAPAMNRRAVTPILLACLLTTSTPALPRSEPAPLRVASSVEGVVVTPLSSLPKAPADPGERELCAHFLKTPQSAAGRQVSAAGWAVTSEARIGRFQAVGFAGRFTQGTSGSCEIAAGNVGIFDGETLRAIVYAPKTPARSIGRAVPFGRDGLRLWDGGLLPLPLADLRLDGADGLGVVPLAPLETFCDGKSLVPNVYSQPITRAREALRQLGWNPVKGPAPDHPQSREAELMKRGVVEVDGCSGTGFGYCSYGYESPAAILSLATVGDADDPAVSSYDVRCRR
ncbi:hypothetical protein [Methylobacterium sp. B4]|uniref:hypothetical protein n=1 Tax=Methylobacterium sp. B4 TaxID=1938755 RepID=UPI000D80C705|nr:hypothetical protein [Methylobacterium sp. B4]PXW63791.1 hypothetical protein BY998_105172 [Methylobacterium sp. B4]